MSVKEKEKLPRRGDLITALRRVAEWQVEKRQRQERGQLIRDRYNKLLISASDSESGSASASDEELNMGMKAIDEQANEIIREAGRSHLQRTQRRQVRK